MKDRITPIVGIVTALLLLLVVYVGSYYSLVIVGWPSLSPNERGKHDRIVLYRFYGRTAELVFHPMNMIDRRIRHDEWEEEPGPWMLLIN